MNSFVLGFFVAAVVSSVSGGQILTSPLTTNWGDWGTFEKCPTGSRVIAVQLKTDPWDFYDGLFDDTCANGIRFFCGAPGTSHYTAVITSTEGEFGKWGNVFTCNGDGYMTGFMIRTVEQGTPLVDESATNNVRILCAGSSSGFMELDGEGWGEWSNPRVCASSEYVCGLQTQVEKPQGASVDDTSLNNIRVECCDL